MFINNNIYGMSYFQERIYIENSGYEDLLCTIIQQDGITNVVDIYRNGVYHNSIEKLQCASVAKYPIPIGAKESFIVCQTNISVTALEIFQRVIKAFIVYDSKGNIVLTMDDINENTFITFGDMATEYNFIDHIIKINPDIVEAGRRKYAGRN
jgi:hypothetical protein